MLTKKDIDYIRINYGIIQVKEIAKTLGVNPQYIQMTIKKHNIKKNPVQLEYAIYFKDEFKFIGTAEECVERLGISRSTLTFYTTPAHRKRVYAQTSDSDVNRVIAVKLGYFPVFEEEYHAALKRFYQSV